MLARTLAFAAGFAAMEVIAWAAHRFLMHGPLWSLHRSHHEPGRRGAQPNDLFGLLFAGVAVALFAAGASLPQPPLWWAGLGVTAYGAVYALVHDGLVHGRFGLRPIPARGPLRRVVQAHPQHHAVRERRGCVAFGLLWPGDVQAHARRLRRRS
ncbi:MAG: sterol desaturase family protein [Phenylobacterium sp.]